jgi:hypothetical protein
VYWTGRGLIDPFSETGSKAVDVGFLTQSTTMARTLRDP